MKSFREFRRQTAKGVKVMRHWLPIVISNYGNKTLELKATQVRVVFCYIIITPDLEEDGARVLFLGSHPILIEYNHVLTKLYAICCVCSWPGLVQLLFCYYAG